MATYILIAIMINTRMLNIILGSQK